MKRTLIAAALLALPATVAAQTASPGAGPLVIERLENHFVVAPDFKITDIDGDAGQLAGGYGGWLAEDTLLVGGAAYWLVNGPDDSEMVYGGLLVGWNTPAKRRIQFGARGLVGFGTATLGTDITHFARFGSRRGAANVRPEATTVRVRGEDDFFVFEPQFTLVTKLTNHIGVTWGAGYRLTGFTDFADDRLGGVTGSIALQWTP